MAAEALFQPHLLGLEAKGMGELLFSTIQKAPIDCRPDLYQHIVLRNVFISVDVFLTCISDLFLQKWRINNVQWTSIST